MKGRFIPSDGNDVDYRRKGEEIRVDWKWRAIFLGG